MKWTNALNPDFLQLLALGLVLLSTISASVSTDPEGKDNLLACVERAIFCVCTVTSSRQINHGSAYYVQVMWQKETKRRTRAESVQPAGRAGTGCHHSWDQAAVVTSVFNSPGRCLGTSVMETI